MKKREQPEPASAFPYEVLTTAELAERLKVKGSWVVDQENARDRRSNPHLQAGQALSLPMAFAGA
jgi:hypothetical protein